MGGLALKEANATMLAAYTWHTQESAVETQSRVHVARSAWTPPFQDLAENSAVMFR